MTRSPTAAMINSAMLKLAREHAALTLDEAADKIEVPFGRLAKWESGKSSPTFDELLIISEVYALPVSMFYLSEWPDPPLLKKDKKAKKAFDYLKSEGFTADDYRDKIEEDDVF